ncbi:hypothetical protein [Mesorhizobium silamurunense]|uniref:hypothetical protein n=1 Tax=Mesorhizobium silamurunense TaxID=499528 RepID=UPI0017807113|nr:hypothetical protein [Mesorhizobium silamurunense]
MVTDFEMYAGDTKIVLVIVRDENNDLVDITGWTFRWRLAKNVKSSPLVSKASGTGIQLTDPSNGEFEVAINAADTDGFKGGVYYHEAEGVSFAGSVATVVTGAVTIKPTLIRNA